MPDLEMRWVDLDNPSPSFNIDSDVDTAKEDEIGESANTASSTLETGMESLENAMQSLAINNSAANTAFLQFQSCYTKTLSESASNAQDAVGDFDEEMRQFILKTREFAPESKELSELLDQMKHVRNDEWSLEDRSSELAEQFAILRLQIENRKCEDAYLPGFTVSFKEDDELKEAVWELESRFRIHMNMLEELRNKQCELLLKGYHLQATIGLD
ncbi:hypothetical protein N7466_010619 [Penicillium verhagenii]|uniref:uncharacterized protein n=1 Tax=Penicillium verhagenii TaxID=1562060 RepID=UPI0025453F58|nr:uncharacterized protein N7466_010619 [Penicillium verhagenii]KAJ5918627.1 hypothetical protein N7466_010619 [Penicillium verhagenii]